MSRLDDIKAFVQANPGAVWWPDEILIRGIPDPSGKQGGQLGGAHLMIGVQMPAADGTTQRKLFGPYNVSNAPADVPMGKVLSALQTQQQATIEARDAAIADLQASLSGQKSAADAQLADLTRAHADELAKLATTAQEQVKTQADDLAGQYNQALSQLNATHAEGLAGRDATIAALHAQLADLQSLIDLIGGEPEGQKIATSIRQRKLDALKQQVAAEEAALKADAESTDATPVADQPVEP